VGPRAVLLVVALGGLANASCSTDTPAGGPNAPCTRPKDCADGLTCTPEGFCVSPEAGTSDAASGADSSASDAGRAD